eukprot:4716227-Amphidinium_carterae.2
MITVLTPQTLIAALYAMSGLYVVVNSIWTLVNSIFNCCAMLLLNNTSGFKAGGAVMGTEVTQV